ncbi:unnamed protein product, partial [Mesorhabditis belari]|uniref:Uncharacterized protein n=1 Tax=Mesorhabditis belari TaxID=2138241 RepID=A0AAF3EU86_9BILA
MDADAEVRHYMDKRYTREYSKRRGIPWSTADSRLRGSQGNLATIKEPSIPSPDYSPIRELEGRAVEELARAKILEVDEELEQIE